MFVPEVLVGLFSAPVFGSCYPVGDGGDGGVVVGPGVCAVVGVDPFLCCCGTFPGGESVFEVGVSFDFVFEFGELLVEGYPPGFGRVHGSRGR